MAFHEEKTRADLPKVKPEWIDGNTGLRDINRRAHKKADDRENPSSVSVRIGIATETVR